MASGATKRTALPFNPEMLRWAREWRHRSLEEAAHKVGKSPDDVLEWERGKATPTVRQARILADFYERPFIEFFYKSPPELAASADVPDYRLYRDRAASDDGNAELAHIQRWAEEQRLNALDLFGLVGDQPPQFPDNLRFTISDRADIAAERARAALAFPLDEQIGIPSSERHTLPRIFRHKLEAAGVLTLKRTDLSDYGARGMCLALFPLPVVIFASEAPSAQAFTLGHELGHVLLRQSAISGALPASGGSASIRAIEEWCNRFAAAFLIPADALGLMLPRPGALADAIPDGPLIAIANRFRVSPHAMLIRMVHLHYVKPSYYWDVKRPEFEEQEGDYQSGGRPKYYGSRYRSRQGDLYTSLVLDAWANGAITNHNAAEFMGIRNMTHLSAVRDWFHS